MDWGMVGALGETVGAAAVVVSLLYVARQVRSARIEAQAQRRDNVIAQTNRLMELLAGDPELSDIYLRGVESFHALAPVERVRFSALMTHLFTSLEQAFHADRSGQWPEWSSQDFKATTDEFAAYAGVQEWWQLRRGVFSPGFAEHVDYCVASLGSAKSEWVGTPVEREAPHRPTAT